MFEISYNEDDNTLFYKVSGFWTMADLLIFQTKLGPCVKTAQSHFRNFKVLSDSTQFSVQSSDVATEIANMMNAAVKITEGRKAFVIGSALQKLQYQRTISHTTVGFFTSMDTARAWLKDVA